MKNKKLERASIILKAIAHPSRLAMINGLLKNECNVGQIQKKLSLPQSTVSQHLKVLKDAGIIEGRQEANRRCYRVIDPLTKMIIENL